MRREALAQDPLSTDDILTGFYRPGTSRPVPPTAQAGAVAPVAEHGPLAERGSLVAQAQAQAQVRPPSGNGAAHPMEGQTPFVMPAPVPLEPMDGEGDYCDEPTEMRAATSAGKKPKPSHYKIVCISLYTEDIARLDGLVAELKRRGHTKANKSQVIRAALEQIDLDKVPKAH